MVGDVIELKEKHLATAKEIITLLKKSFPLDGKQKIAIGIAGESGSGKTETGKAIEQALGGLRGLSGDELRRKRADKFLAIGRKL